MISPASLPPRIDDLPEVATAAETFVALHAEAGAAWQQVRDLEDDRRHALEADTNAYAAAIRQGKPDPGQKNVTKLDAELLKARRRSEALKVAVEDAEEELRSAVASHRTEWASLLSEEASKAQAAFDAAVAALSAATAHLSEVNGTTSWLERSSAEHWAYKPGGPSRVPALRSPAGEDYLLSRVLDALSSVNDPPRPPPEVRPLVSTAA